MNRVISLPRMFSVLGVVAFCVLGFTGCGHYQLGTESKLSFRTLYIEPIENQTMLPQAHAVVSTQLRETFARDGRVTLVNAAADADATLKVTLNDYHRDVAAVRED